LIENICITGVSGYLGRRLVKGLLAMPDIRRLIGIDVVPPAEKLPGMDVFRMDIRDSALKSILTGNNIDTVFHLAFVVKPIHDLKKMHDVDMNGTRNVLESCRKAGVRRIIAISSTLAYGAHPDNPPELNEDHPLRGNPSFPYGYQKARVDEMIQDFSQRWPEMTITTLRPCTVFGPRVDNYVSRMLFRPVTVRVSGNNPPVQFVHEDDFVNACLLALKSQHSGAFNIAADGTLTAAEIASIIGTRAIPLPAWLLYPLVEILWQCRAPGIEVNKGYLDYARYSFVSSNQKAKSLLGFEPRYTSREVLDDTLRARFSNRLQGGNREIKTDEKTTA